MNEQNKTPLAEAIDKDRELANASQAISAEVGEAFSELGQLQAMFGISDMLSVGALIKLQAFKDSKGYRKFKGHVRVIGGVEYDLGTWEGYCRSLGKSRLYFDERLTELKLLGEQALANVQRIGMTTTELRKLRQLDTEDQKVIIGEIETNISDKESIIELIEDMSVKHAKEKAELKAENNAKDKIVAQKTAKINEQDKTINEQENQINTLQKSLTARFNAPVHERANAYIGTMAKTTADIIQIFNDIDALYQSMEEEKDLPKMLEINQAHVLQEIISQANMLIDKYYLGNVSIKTNDISFLNADLSEMTIEEQE